MMLFNIVFALREIKKKNCVSRFVIIYES